MEPLTLEQWLESKPSDGFNTIEQSITCQLAESGTDRESDFDLEQEQETRYDNYLKSLTKEY